MMFMRSLPGAHRWGPAFLAFITFTLLSSPLLAYAQSNQITAQEIEQLIKFNTQYRRSNFEQFQKNIERLQYHHDKLSPRQQEELIFFQAYELSVQGDIDGAILLHQKLTNSHNQHIRIRSITLELNLQVIASNYAESNRLVSLLLNEVKHLDDDRLINKLYASIGYFYYHIGDFNLATKYQNLLNLNKLSASEKCLYGTYLRLAQLGAGEIAANAAEVIDLITYCNNIKESITATSLILSNSSHLIEENQANEAINVLKKYEQVILDTNFEPHIIGLYSEYLNAFLKAEMLEQAKPYAEYLVSFANKSNAWTMDNAKNLATYFSLNNQPQKALEYLQQYQSLKQQDQELQLKNLLAQAQGNRQFNEINEQLIAKQKKSKQYNSLVDDLTEQNKALVNTLFVEKIVIAVLFAVSCLLYGVLFFIRSRQQVILNKKNFDPVTQTLARRFFFDQMASSIYQARLASQPSCMLVFAVHGLKDVNRQLGVMAGDNLLRHIVSSIRPLLANNDLIGRIGANEFAILLRNQSAIQAESFIKQINHTLKIKPFTDVTNPIPIHLNTGIADTTVCKYVPKQLYKDAYSVFLQCKQEPEKAIVRYTPCHKQRPRFQQMNKLKYVFKS
ncbi:GGDEF domain-containing protein [Thalassotalea aquiviva]|uniref:GGDEF domain-containing protein n=1 Tax=Thalassotalea aquiviva TaxID=3242415 RepID=UPI00352B1168